MIGATYESSFGNMKVIWERRCISKRPLEDKRQWYFKLIFKHILEK
jgi:hypothetical protein